MINNVVLMGRLAGDPELRSTTSNISTTRFSIAIDRNYVKAGQERQTDWIDCIAWRQTAEFISKYFHKGSMIALTGSIQTRNYEDKQGNKRRAVEVVIDQASFCGGKNEGGNNFAETGNAHPAGGQTPAPEAFSNGDANAFEPVGDEDDLPF